MFREAGPTGSYAECGVDLTGSRKSPPCTCCVTHDVSIHGRKFLNCGQGCQKSSGNLRWRTMVDAFSILQMPHILHCQGTVLTQKSVLGFFKGILAYLEANWWDQQDSAR